jgi:putative nucleotidyltransferase with HDIG domain
MPELDDLARRVQELEAENHLLKTTLTNVTVEGLGDALDLKDSATTGHSKRVTAFAIGIARALGMPREKIAVLARGAFLHDIGKMAIPDQILKKPTKLTPDINSSRRFRFSRDPLRLFMRITNATMALAIRAR